jgi:hypothetical protein
MRYIRHIENKARLHRSLTPAILPKVHHRAPSNQQYPSQFSKSPNIKKHYGHNCNKDNNVVCYPEWNEV